MEEKFCLEVIVTSLMGLKWTVLGESRSSEPCSLASLVEPIKKNSNIASVEISPEARP